MLSTSGIGIYVAYLALSLILATYYTSKSDNKFVAFLLLFWIFAGPILEAKFYIKPAWMPFGLPFARILLITFICILLIDVLKGRSEKSLSGWRKHKPKFDKYLFFYVGLVFFAVLVNINELELKSIIAIPLDPLTFLVIYLVVRKKVTKRMFNILLDAIVVMAIINSLVAYIQVFISPEFMRIEEARRAFGNVYRAYGVFSSEYVLGSFQMIALFLAWTRYSSAIRNIIVPMLVFSIIVTFHRMDIIVLFVCVLVYLRYYSPRKMKAATFMFVLMGVIVVVPIYSVYQSMGGDTGFVKERLMADTVSGRMKQFGLVLRSLPRYPLGMGSLYTPSYQNLMIDNGLVVSETDKYNRAVVHALEVHNGFLSIAIQYGILAMIAFVVMLVKMINYFRKRVDKKTGIVAAPILSVLIWAMVNMSNGIISFRAHNVLIIAIVIGAFTGMFIKGYMGKIREKE